MSLRELIALEERQFQAQVRRSAPGMLPIKTAATKAAPVMLQHSPSIAPDVRTKGLLKDQTDAVLEAWASGTHVKQIASDREIATRDVRRIIEVARLRKDARATARPKRVAVAREAFFVRLPADAHRKIREAAENRGLDEGELTCRLVEILAHDSLIDAILDDDS